MYRKLAALFFLLLLDGAANAQELEPRRWSHLPTGINFAALVYAYTEGNIFLDPAVVVEGAESEIHTAGLGYVRTFGAWGRTARVDFKLPLSDGNWSGIVDGEPASAERQGAGDAAVRFAINLYGSPAQAPSEFVPNISSTIVGAGIDITVPVGQYYEDRLINLGSNRWAYRPHFGVVHTSGKWAIEGTASIWFFGDNDDYQERGRVLEQDTLYALQTHLVYTFRPGLWASLSGAYGVGAKTTVDGVPDPEEQRNVLWALSFGFPIDSRQGIKIAYQRGETLQDTGVDYDRYILAYSFMWGR